MYNCSKKKLDTTKWTRYSISIRKLDTDNYERKSTDERNNDRLSKDKKTNKQDYNVSNEYKTRHINQYGLD